MEGSILALKRGSAAFGREHVRGRVEGMGGGGGGGGGGGVLTQQIS